MMPVVNACLLDLETMILDLMSIYEIDREEAKERALEIVETGYDREDDENLYVVNFKNNGVYYG